MHMTFHWYYMNVVSNHFYYLWILNCQSWQASPIGFYLKAYFNFTLCNLKDIYAHYDLLQTCLYPHSEYCEWKTFLLYNILLLYRNDCNVSLDNMENIDVHHWQWVTSCCCAFRKYGTWIQKGGSFYIRCFICILLCSWALTIFLCFMSMCLERFTYMEDRMPNVGLGVMRGCWGVIMGQCGGLEVSPRLA